MLTDEQLAAIKARQEQCEYLVGADPYVSSDVRQLVGMDAPALVAEVERLRRCERTWAYHRHDPKTGQSVPLPAQPKREA